MINNKREKGPRNGSLEKGDNRWTAIAKIDGGL